MRIAPLVLFTMLAVGTASMALAQDKPMDARLQFSSTSFGLLFGYNQGQGTLEFRGREYPFSIAGLKVATVGITQVDALGQVYRLRELADFPGRYYAVEGAFTVAQGGGHTLLRNEKGVTLYLQNVQRGIELTLGGGGVDIVLTESAPSPAARAGRASSATPSASATPPVVAGYQSRE